MRIGILIRNFEDLSNWELRIIKSIIDSPIHELLLLIQDARTGQNKKTLRRKLSSLSNINLAKLLLNLHLSIEKKIFPQRITVEKASIIEYLNNVSTIEVSPQRNGLKDIFNDDDSLKVRAYELDILLKHEFSIIEGEILFAARYGIWFLNHSDYSVKRGGPPGFWEIILKEKNIVVSLCQLVSANNLSRIIDKAVFNYLPLSLAKTNNMILEASVSLLIKNINRLENGKYSTTESLIDSTPSLLHLDLFYTLRYFLHFYIYLLKKLIEKCGYKFLGNRYYCWSIFVGEGSVMDSKLSDLIPFEMPKGECWADPFLFNREEDRYVIFENYSYSSKKGKISCGILNNRKLYEITDILELNNHLSYPYIIKDREDIFIMPESRQNRRLEIYQCINFPDSWKLYSTAFEGEFVIDASLFIDDCNQKWLFVNKQSSSMAPVDCELYIYQVDTLRMENMIPHKQNPVIIDSRSARNAGPIFRYKNEYYRPSQNSTGGLYGKSININKVITLTIDEYHEECIFTINPDFKKGIVATHHLYQDNDLFLIDAAYRRI